MGHACHSQAPQGRGHADRGMARRAGSCRSHRDLTLYFHTTAGGGQPLPNTGPPTCVAAACQAAVLLLPLLTHVPAFCGMQLTWPLLPVCWCTLRLWWVMDVLLRMRKPLTMLPWLADPDAGTRQLAQHVRSQLQGARCPPHPVLCVHGRQVPGATCAPGPC